MKSSSKADLKEIYSCCTYVNNNQAKVIKTQIMLQTNIFYYDYLW